MPHSLTLPVVAALSIVGATATGITLGRSASAEINPNKFANSGGTRFYGDLAPNRRADWSAVSAAEYQQQATTSPPPAAPGGCVGCSAWPIAPRPVHDAAVDRALNDAWRQARAPAPEARDVETVMNEQPRPDPVQARIRRYASYPISREEAPAPPEQRGWDGPDGDDTGTG